MQSSLIANWIPYRLDYSGGDEWHVKWLDLGIRRMTEPFFDETIQLCRFRQRERSPLNSLSDTHFLSETCKGLEALAPDAFVFHVSRCGSTLLSQAFSHPDENIVVAEAPLLDEILRAREKQPDLALADQKRWFRAALQLMGQKRNFKETHYIIKLDSWHLHFYEPLRQWFPQTPFFFISRRPDEILASHDKRRGIQAIPGMIPAALLKTQDPGSFGGDLNRYTAQVLEQFYIKMQHINQLHHPHNCFFDYANGAKALVEEFSSFTGIPVRDMEQVDHRLGYHSKAAQELFTPESTIDSQRFFFRNCQEAYAQLRVCLEKIV